MKACKILLYMFDYKHNNMIPNKLNEEIKKYCMGHKPTIEQENEIIDMAVALNIDENSASEISAYIQKLAKGPTNEEMNVISAIIKIIKWVIIIAVVIFVGYWLIQGILFVYYWIKENLISIIIGICVLFGIIFCIGVASSK